tara:strand:- start:289 stop:516 length:228 start_codon:yes stop_codon:yes gene_type:complete
MTPKEKAEDLVNKHLNINLSQVDDLVDGIRIRLAQESALITVEENIYTSENCFYKEELNYWLDVRCELNTLILGE